MKAKRENYIHLVIIGVLVLMLAGYIYGWSVISGPILGDFPEWTSTQASLTFTISMAFFCGGGIISGNISKRYKNSPKITLTAAGVLLFAGCLIVANVHSLVVLYFGYSMLCGLAAGFCHNTILSAIPGFYPKNHALVTGILLMGFGSSSMLIGKLYSAILASNGNNWRGFFIGFGILSVVLLPVCAIFAKKPQPASTGKTESATDDLTTAQMLHTRSFPALYALAVLATAVGLVIIGHARPLVQEISPELPLTTISTIAGLISIFNGIGRVAYGTLFDHCGPRVNVVATCGVMTLGTAVLVAAVLTKSLALITISYIIVGLSYGGVPIFSTALIRDFYGETYYAQNFALSNTNIFVASIFTTIAGIIVDIFGGYSSVLVLLAVLLIIIWPVQHFVRKE